MADNWRTPEFRQSVITKITENIQSFQVTPPISIAEMENTLFNKANSKEEYLQYISKVLVYLKKRAANMNNTPDPMGALQSLANQGTSEGANINNMGMQVAGQSQQNMGQVGPSGNMQNSLLQNLNQRPVQPMNAQAMHNKVPRMNMMQNQQMIVNQMGQIQNAQTNSMMINRNQLKQGLVSQQIGQQQHQIAQKQVAAPQMGSQQLQMGQQQQMTQKLSQQQQMRQQQQKTQQMVQQQQRAQQMSQQKMGTLQLRIGRQQQMTGPQMGLQQHQIGQQQQQMTGPPMSSQQHQSVPQQQMTGPPMGPNQTQQALQNQMHSQTNIQNQMHNQINHQMSSSMNSGMQQPQPPRSLLQQQQHISQINVNQMAQQQQQQQQQLGHAQIKTEFVNPINLLNFNQMAQQQQQQQQLGHAQIKTEFGNPACPGGQRNITPSKFLLSPSPSLPSPNSLTAPGSNQMVTSPALVLSPNPQHTPHVGQRSSAMALSPSSSSLNTPGGMIGGATSSPMPDNQMSQACKEKIQKLRKYIEPLHRMILKLNNEGYTENMSKMKKLLEILTNPGPGTKLDVLQKCEVVLEKMDFRKFEVTGTGSTTSFLKENQFSTPLLEVVSALLQNPTANNILHRTFGPSIESFAPEFKNIPPSLKKRKSEEFNSEISDILQGEIARLDQRFKVSFDLTQPTGSKSIQLVCWLDDKHLPCVPPILVTVPEDYPTVPPKCDVIDHEYVTPYLTAVKDALNTRLNKLPTKFSVSQLLDSWEMSVRQAARSKIEESESTHSFVSSTTTEPFVQSTSNNANNSITNDMDISYHKSDPSDLENNALIRELLS